ncbi:hypothetical protein, partial [Streptomyces sp. NPDC056361]|uniref:hypothetical protein n=1 Tax=Streptomyces sp. NPDC056361 TaxID=3345795 RepID=UPI0035DB58AA
MPSVPSWGRRRAGEEVRRDVRIALGPVGISRPARTGEDRRGPPGAARTGEDRRGAGPGRGRG